jgi:hypothetical protein
MMQVLSQIVAGILLGLVFLTFGAFIAVGLFVLYTVVLGRRDAPYDEDQR